MSRYSMYVCICTEIQQGYSFSAIKDQTIYMVVYLVKLRRDAKSRFIQDIICEELPCYLKEEFCAIMYCLTCTCISMSMSPSTMWWRYQIMNNYGTLLARAIWPTLRFVLDLCVNRCHRNHECFGCFDYQNTIISDNIFMY
jgi:hypothetical protein